MKKILFNPHWLFAFENHLDCFNNFGFEKYSDAIGAPARFYDHSNWQPVTLPHDWAVALPKTLRANTFAGARPITRWHRFMTERHSDVDKVFSVGWYRRSFTPDPAWQGKRIFLEFEGVFRDAMVWVNGAFLDRHASGYTSFFLEITDHLVFDGDNSIAVRVDSSQNEGWWYEGAGIYRNVFLHVAEPVYVKPRSTVIRTALDGRVDAQCVLVNDTPEPFRGEVRFEAGGVCVSVPACVEPWGEAAVSAALLIEHPVCWHVDHPHLYSLLITVGQEQHCEPFGIRTVGFDPDRGFLLNGEPFKIHGACVHQDFGGVGVALTDNLQYYKIARLKAMGVNAYRCSHHAPAPALLRACDELGMLVMDETRLFGTSPEAVRQLTDVIERDRNHPSVFLWSLGNEEFSVQNDAWGFRLMEKMSRIARRLDPTRAMTYSGNNGPSFAGANGAAEVRGVNYIRNDGGEGGAWLDRYHAAHPHQPLIGTEEGSYVLSRGGAATDFGSGQLDSTGLVTMMWGSTPKGWVKYFEMRDYLAGSFLWTGFDYRGEPNPFITGNVSSSFGTIDLCGMEKPPFHYYRAWWTQEDVLALAPHWNHRAGETAEISAFTNCEQITLYLNGRLIETRAVERFDAPVFRIPFEPGVLRAEGVRNGRALSCELRTAGPCARIGCRCVLEATGPQDTAIYELTALDDSGIWCPAFDGVALLQPEGCDIVGVGSGDPASLDPEQFPPVEEALYLRSFLRDGRELYAVPSRDVNRLRRRHDWLETEPAGNGFEDDERRVAWFADSLGPDTLVTLTARVSGAAGYEYIEFERLGGGTRVFLNDVEIGSTLRNGRISFSDARPYRFYADFREGENEIKILSSLKDFSGMPVSGEVKIGRRKAQTCWVRLHCGRARVFVRGQAGTFTVSCPGL